MEIEQLEELAFGVDRAAAIAALLPGTPEHDYWRGVTLQHEQRLDEVDLILAEWKKRHGRDALVDRLRRRQLLLRAGAELPKYAEELRREAGVDLADQAEVVAQAQRFPTRLDPAWLDEDALVHAELTRRADLASITDHALPRLALRARELDATRRRNLLQRLARANVPSLVAAIADDLAEKSSAGFGSLGVHRQLTLAQLEELAALRPAVRLEAAWVDAVLARLAPPGFTDLRTDRDELERTLERLWAFASTLAPSFNPLKAQIQYHRLDLGRARGRYDRARLLAYLALPRSAHYVAKAWLDRIAGDQVMRFGTDYARIANLAPVRDDEPLVRDYLEHFLVAEDGDAFATWLSAEWLTDVVAVTRLLAGAADSSRWATLLGPSRLKELRDRVEIVLTPRNAPAFDSDSSVSLEVDVKGVRELEVKVFRINAVAYFLARGAEADTSLDLDGMVASDERRIEFDAPPIRRHTQRIDLPSCARPGTYVVELIGNGRSSRALIRKGALRHVVRIGAAGPVIRVLDERGTPLPDARVWLGGREFAPRVGSDIVIPFSTRPGPVPFLLVHGEIAQREMLEHPAESISLSAGFHLERESLVPGLTARVLCRPTLTVAGAPASLSLLEDPRVEVTATDLAGTTSSKIQAVTLRDDAEVAVDITVPEGVTRITACLRARARIVSTQQTVELDDDADAAVGLIHTSDKIEALHLAVVAGEHGAPARHALHLLGKTGEALPARAVSLSLQHRAITTPINVTLETDERGVIDLGVLEGIERIAATLASSVVSGWSLAPTLDLPPAYNALEGEAITLPAPVGLRADDVTLVELRGEQPAYDAGAHVVLERRALVIAGLRAGQFRLTCRGVASATRITVAPASTPTAGWATAGRMMLELSPPLPLVRELAIEGDELVVRMSGAGPFTRLHVIATRFRPDAILPRSLLRSPRIPRVARSAALLSHYVSGRDIGEEYRYVIERRSAKRRPGTMLEKPSLLLNPWALRTTASVVQEAMLGGAYAASPPRAAMAPAPASRMASYGSAQEPLDTTAFASTDFLARPAIVLDGKQPDERGEVRIPLAELGEAQSVRVLAVDPAFTSSADLALPATSPAHRDRRLRLALDPARHHAEDRRVEGVPAGTPLVVEDVRTGKLELVDTVARAHQLLLTLGVDDALRELGFVTEWHSLDEATRRAKYSKYACHEVHLFLWRKDPAFFASVVRPYLAHKRHKTFVDRFLLGEDLSAYREPWAFGRLNTLERILLGAGLPAVKDGIARLTGDAVDLIPRDPERDAHLLATLLGASALESAPAAAAAAEPMMDLMRDEDAGAMAPKMKKASRRRDEGDEVLASMSERSRSAPPGAAMAGSVGAARGGGKGSMNDLAADAMERERGESLYRGADKTEEWAECNWWHRRIEDSGPDLIPPNRLWRDLARHGLDPSAGPFLSPHLGDCTSSFAEAMCALAFLDLPFSAGAHDSALEDTRLTVTPRSHALVARTRIIELEEAKGRSPVLIGQSYFRADDRWEWDGAEQREKYVTAEMLTGVVYQCQVVVTNPTGTRKKLDVLLQIPRGSMAVSRGFVTKTMNLELDAYGTRSVEYAFYFPREGRWSHFPAHVTEDGVLVAAAEGRELDVVREARSADLGSWAHVSQRGTLEEVTGFLERANLGRVDLARVAWRMRDRDAFERVTALLEARHVYDDHLWSYALAHHDGRRAAEWLRHQDAFVSPAGPLVGASALTELDPIARGWYQHLEYAPLINARAHQLGARRRILNDALASQYRSFLEVVAHRPTATADDRLAAAHYLLCLDRIDDALTLLGAIRSDEIASRLQHDYLVAYAACYRGDLAEARRLAARWHDHPVDRWRNRFAALSAMLDEAATPSQPIAAPVDADSRDQQMLASAARQPTLDLVIERGEAVFLSHGLGACQVRLYRMDIELLFSRQPFVQGDVERFSFIEPGRVLDVPLAAEGRTVVPIPADLHGQNLVVEAVAPGLRKAVAHYAHDLGIQLAHTFGQLRVVRASTQAALAATYVKVYGRQIGGRVAFFKDGYTDLAGRFDYATLSTDDLDRVERFAILVASDDAGATILEAPPPPR